MCVCVCVCVKLTWVESHNLALRNCSLCQEHSPPPTFQKTLFQCQFKLKHIPHDVLSMMSQLYNFLRLLQNALPFLHRQLGDFFVQTLYKFGNLGQGRILLLMVNFGVNTLYLSVCLCVCVYVSHVCQTNNMIRVIT